MKYMYITTPSNYTIMEHLSTAITVHNAKTYSNDHSILEVGEPLVALIAVVLSRSALSDLFIAVSIGAGFVETVL